MAIKAQRTLPLPTTGESKRTSSPIGPFVPQYTASRDGPRRQLAVMASEERDRYPWDTAWPRLDVTWGE
jgi:hypothetical protein